MIFNSILFGGMQISYIKKLFANIDFMIVLYHKSSYIHLFISIYQIHH